jgi:integration host factor subunit alpha
MYLSAGAGKFSVKEKYERNGRNPETGEPITLSARRVVTFKCWGVLRAAMNGEDAENGDYIVEGRNAYGRQ